MADLAGCGAFAATFVACAAIAFLTAVANWSASPVSVRLYLYLTETLTRERCHRLSLRSAGLGGAMLLLAYLVDLWKWTRATRLAAAYLAVALAGLLAGAALQTLEVPMLPACLGVALMTWVARVLRLRLFSATHERSVLYGVSAAFLSLAIALFAAWSLWLATPEGSEQIDEALTTELSFVLAWCPCLMGAMCCAVSLITWMRATLTERLAEVEEGTLTLPPQLQVTVILMMVMAVMAWIAASVAVESAFLSRLILKIDVLVFLGTIFYIADWVGRRRVALMVERNKKLSQLRGLLQSDWLKALLVLPSLPFLPPLLLVDVLHQAFRRSCQSCSGLPDDFVGRGCLTQETSRLLEELRSWDLASVTTKVLYVCIAHFSIQVGVSQGLVLFLAWFNETVEPWSFLSATAVLFVVEIALFLFPPVAGVPLYMIGAIVIIPKVMHAGFSFWTGVAVGTAFNLMLKLVAAALEQKAIGLPFSGSVAVKKFIGVHTPFMKAVRLILSQPGLRTAKVAVLCGGPDWPTSVITGIMDLPCGEMLLGTVPVVFVIFPTTVSAAFKMEATTKSDPQSFETIAGLSLMAATVIQGLGSAAAAYYAQAVMDEFHDEFNKEGSSFQRDPQEREVLALCELEERQAKVWKTCTCWQAQPFLARLVLVVGTVFSAITVGLVVNPQQKAFAEFTITDRVSELPNGSVLSIVLPPGWRAFGSVSVVVVCLALNQAWCRVAVLSSERRHRETVRSLELAQRRGGGWPQS